MSTLGASSLNASGLTPCGPGFLMRALTAAREASFLAPSGLPCQFSSSSTSGNPFPEIRLRND